MKPELLAKLRGAKDLRALAESVVALCENFGPVRSYECVRFVHGDGEQMALCFVELESEAQQLRLVHEFDAITFGNGVCLKIPMQGEFAGVTGMYAGVRTRRTAPESPLRGRET